MIIPDTVLYTLIDGLAREAEGDTGDFQTVVEDWMNEHKIRAQDLHDTAWTLTETAEPDEDPATF